MAEFRTDGKWGLLILLAIAVVFRLNVALPTAEAAPGDIYCVASDGDDSNPGTEAQPWRTIQKAANTLSAGDGVIVLAGNYDERVQVTRSGDAGAPITYQADGDVTTNGFTVNADYITIKGFTVTATACNWNDTAVGIWITGDYCVIEDDYAYYSPRGGIHTRDSSTGCLIKNNRAYRNGMVGIEVRGTNHLVENNEVWGSVAYHAATGCSGDADGFRFFGSGHIFRGNYIHDIGFTGDNEGYSPHVDAFQTWKDPGMNTGMVFEGNYIDLPEWQALHEYGKGWEIEGLKDSIIRNNIVKAHLGIGSWAGNGNENLTIVNNTFIGNSNPPCSVGSNCWPVAIGLDGTPNCVIKNNILVDWRYRHIDIGSGSGTGLDMDYNLLYKSDGSTPGGTPQAHDLWDIDPKFVNPAQNDFHLQSNSPAIDAGVTLSEVTNDYDGNPCPQGTEYDIGAHEYAGGVQPTPTPQPTSTPTVTPRPTSTPIPTSTPTPNPTVAPVQLPLRINSAGQDYTDASGELWCTDQLYSPGGWGYIGGNTVNRWDEDPALNIAGTIDDPLYVAERYAVSGYQVDLPNGTYDVILHFAETFSGITGAGQRVFDVAIEGQTRLDDFDPFAEAGFAYATSKSVPNVMVTDGQLDITFIPNVQNPEINAIEVLPSGGIEPPASPWAIYLPIVAR